MKKNMIVCRSQTEALKCTRLLEGAGIRGLLTKPPREMSAGSCSWGIKIRAEELSTAQRRLQEKQFSSCQIYEYDEAEHAGRGRFS